MLFMSELNTFMIIISTTGKVKNQQRIEQFINDCFNHYFLSQLERDVEVEIIFKSRLEGDASGWCTGDTKEILIEVSKNSNEQLLCRNIAHEIVHAKQFLRGENGNSQDMEQEALEGEKELVRKYL